MTSQVEKREVKSEQTKISFDSRKKIELPGFMEVSRDDWYGTFMHLDAILSVVGNYPYSVEVRLRHKHDVIAKSIDSYGDINDPDAEWIEKRYYIKK